jgi:hypothetical protein
MKTINVFFSLAILALGFTACDKDQDEVAPTKTDLLTAKTWKMTGLKVDPPLEVDDIVIDDLFETCMSDNTLKFNVNHTYVADEGSNNCYPEDPQTESGEWEFNAAETELIIDDEVADIKQLTSNSLKIAQELDLDVLLSSSRLTTVQDELPSSITVVLEFKAE